MLVKLSILESDKTVQIIFQQAKYALQYFKLYCVDKKTCMSETGKYTHATFRAWLLEGNSLQRSEYRH